MHAKGWAKLVLGSSLYAGVKVGEVVLANYIGEKGANVIGKKLGDAIQPYLSKIIQGVTMAAVTTGEAALFVKNVSPQKYGETVVEEMGHHYDHAA